MQQHYKHCTQSSNYTCYCVLISFLIVSFCSCRRPDQASPNDPWCSSGINVLSVDDSNLPSETKNAFYAAPASYTHTGHPDYNDRLPIIIIPVRFRNQFPFNTAVTIPVIRDAFFETGNGSVKDYFSENSWGQYNIQEGSIAPGISLPLDTIDYAATAPFRDWTRNPNLARDICQQSAVDWSRLDANGDHIISRHEGQICFMIADNGGGATRPATVNISTQTGQYQISCNFVYFSCKRNDNITRGIDDISYNYSTIWHELCHGMFGLPDRYAAYCGSGKTGEYDLMSDNCAHLHMSIFDKMKIGWCRPRILVRPSQRSDHQRHCYTFPNSETSPAALILWDNSNPDQYWLVENRNMASSPRDFDRHLPASGLAIWWVDAATNALSLLDASRLSVLAPDISYDPSVSQTNVLFHNTTGTRDSSYNLLFLPGKRHISIEIAIRAVSPAGATMYAEF